MQKRGLIDREVKVGAAVLTEKGSIYVGSNFEQPSSLFNTILQDSQAGAQFFGGGRPHTQWASSLCGGIGDDRVFV